MGENVRKLILDWTLPGSSGDLMIEHLKLVYEGGRAMTRGLRCHGQEGSYRSGGRDVSLLWEQGVLGLVLSQHDPRVIVSDVHIL